MTIIDASSGYHYLKLDNITSGLTTFACYFGRHRCITVPFGITPVGDIYQQKIEKLFKDLANVLGIADDILIIGYAAGGGDHDRVMQICHWENKPKPNKCYFRCTKIPFFGEDPEKECIQTQGSSTQ